MNYYGFMIQQSMNYYCFLISETMKQNQLNSYDALCRDRHRGNYWQDFLIVEEFSIILNYEINFFFNQKSDIYIVSYKHYERNLAYHMFHSK